MFWNCSDSVVMLSIKFYYRRPVLMQELLSSGGVFGLYVGSGRLYIFHISIFVFENIKNDTLVQEFSKLFDLDRFTNNYYIV